MKDRPMSKNYEIVAADGTPFIAAATVAACARVCGVSPKRQAEQDAQVLNDEAGSLAYVARPVSWA